MLDVNAALTRMNIPMSTAGAIRAVAEKFEGEGADALSTASKLIKELIGIDISFTDANEARLTAMALAEAAVKTGGKFEDEAAALGLASVRARDHMVKNAWMYTKKEATPTEVKAVVEGIETKVAVKADGSIKKGGKQVLAAELYKKHVLEAATPATNQQFIAILVKELGMSKAGATTYAYNCKKQLGEPAGGLVKAKKGRKPKK